MLALRKLNEGVSMTPQRRIELTGGILEGFFEEIFRGDVSEFSAHKGLSYSLIYNLVQGRVSFERVNPILARLQKT